MQTGVSAAIPALLAGLAGTTAKPGGSQKLVDAINRDSGVLHGFPSMLGGGGQSSFIDKGSQMSTSLLGRDEQSALSEAVAKFGGFGGSVASSLLGMLTTVVMGLIGKEVGSRNLDASSLTGFFNSQKSNIAQAIPRGFSDLLGGTGLLDSLGDLAGNASATVSQMKDEVNTADQTGRLASSAAGSVDAAGQRAAAATLGIPRWLYWLVPIALIAIVLWFALGNRQQPPPAASVENVVVDGVDVGKQLKDSLGALRTSPEGVTDAASAEAALPKLEEINGQVDKFAVALASYAPLCRPPNQTD